MFSAVAVAEEVASVATKTPAPVPAKKANAVRKTVIKKKNASSPVKKVPAAVAPAAPAAAPAEGNDGKLDFQHTPALLELANTDKKDSIEGSEAKPDSAQAINEITGQLLGAETQEVDPLDDDETENDNMIIISSSDDNKNEEYETDVEEETTNADEENAGAVDAIVDDEKTANEVISFRFKMNSFQL